MGGGGGGIGGGKEGRDDVNIVLLSNKVLYFKLPRSSVGQL